MIKSLTHQSLENQKSATAYLYLGVTPFYGEGVAKSAGYRALSSHKELVIDMYLPMIASLNAQKYILQGMEWVSLSILLPFAFVLRIIPFTRDYGNLLISLFFAMYIIAPTTYAMGARVFNDIAVNEPVTVDFPTLSNFNSYGLDGQGPVGASTVLYRVGITIPQAVFLPNFVLIIGITATMSISKALRAIAV
jgi:hypothetical protein